MTNKENDAVTEEQVTAQSGTQGFNPAFVELLHHIGRMIAKDLILKAQQTPENGESSIDKSIDKFRQKNWKKGHNSG